MTNSKHKPLAAQQTPHRKVRIENRFPVGKTMTPCEPSAHFHSNKRTFLFAAEYRRHSARPPHSPGGSLRGLQSEGWVRWRIVSNEDLLFIS